MKLQSTIDELEKLGAITPEQAQASLAHLQQLETSKPTVGQALRYGALGAIAGPTIAGTADLVRGQTPFKAIERDGKALPHGRLRGAAGSVVTGALTSGAVPLLRYHLDRASEMRTLKQFMKEYQQEQKQKTARVKLLGDAVIEVDSKGRSLGKGNLLKEKDADLAMDYPGSYDPGSFKVSPYSGPMSYGPWILPSLLSSLPDLPLDVTVERKKQAASLTPAITGTPQAKLTSAQKVGQPKLTSPSGPTIADVAKPRGYGLPLPGALKGTI